MPKKKTAPPEEKPVEALAAKTGEEETAGLPPEAPAGLEDSPVVVPEDGPAGDIPPDMSPADGNAPETAGVPLAGESLFPTEDDPFNVQASPDVAGMESDSPEYGALLQELGDTAHEDAGREDPLTLDPPPGEDAPEDTGPVSPVPAETEKDMIGEEPAQTERPRGRPRRRQTAEAEGKGPAADPRRERILTIEARDEVQTAEEQEAIIWHEIQNAHWTRRILTWKLDSVEQTESGMTIAVVNYKGFRVVIPIKEMMLINGPRPSGAAYEELMSRARGILASRLTSEIDFIVKGHENKTRSVVASRRDAMLRKRQTFYLDKNERGEPMIYEGRVVQARVVAVAEKIIRVEVFGVECAIMAHGLSRSWVGNAADDYYVGKRILVRVNKISGDNAEDLTISADVRSVSNVTEEDILKKCVVQGRYAGQVTDIRNGVVFVRLNNGVNAIAHSCYDHRAPGKRDDVSFSVTRLDPEQGIALGIITRIIKQNL